MTLQRWSETMIKKPRCKLLTFLFHMVLSETLIMASLTGHAVTLHTVHMLTPPTFHTHFIHEQDLQKYAYINSKHLKSHLKCVVVFIIMYMPCDTCYIWRASLLKSVRYKIQIHELAFWISILCTDDLASLFLFSNMKLKSFII